ncbi:MAG TPA: cobalt transporter CbiM [Dehalococcoidia bacterium]|jgi:cobalt/nickel transport system permease protein|nr:cobalt transporter CbiM [Dehalococcoidia bacterium]
MHIPDGILPVPVTAAGYAATVVVTWYSVRKINQKENPRQDIPKASLLTAAFFVASWIHIPVPPTSVHLVLNGLLGAVLGYFAFPAILIGLFFQAVMFQHGGLTTLGVNAVIMGLPAIIAHYIFRIRRFGNQESRRKTGIFGFLSGAVAIGISVAMFVLILLTNIPADLDIGTERAALYTLAIAHLPLIAIEGVITLLLAVFLQRVRPRILDGV